MIVAFDGLSCAGKTSIINELTKRSPSKYTIIPEFFVDSKDITTTLCMVNDIAKANYARLIDKSNKVILLDRSYISTLVYTYAESTEKFKSTDHWYRQNIKKGLIEPPDLSIYIRISPEISINRASGVNRFNKKFAWFSETNRAFKKFEFYFSNEIKDSHHVIINSEKINFTELIKEVESSIYSFESNKK